MIQIRCVQILIFAPHAQHVKVEAFVQLGVDFFLRSKGTSCWNWRLVHLHRWAQGGYGRIYPPNGRRRRPPPKEKFTLHQEAQKWFLHVCTIIGVKNFSFNFWPVGNKINYLSYFILGDGGLKMILLTEMLKISVPCGTQDVVPIENPSSFHSFFIFWVGGTKMTPSPASCAR